MQLAEGHTVRNAGMTQETAERLTGLLIAALVIAAVVILAFQVHAASDLFFDAVLWFGVSFTLVGVIIWALFRRPLAMLLFHPRRVVSLPASQVYASLPTTQADTSIWYRYPRWLFPLAGVLLLVLLFLLYALGVLSAGPVFTAMAGLAVGALFLIMVIPETEQEDRRADLPIAMFLAWATLYLLKTGLFFEIVAALSCPGLMAWAAFVYWTDRPRWWIVAAVPVWLIYNLLVFFAFYRPP